MPIPYLEAHTIAPSGMGRGSYARVPCTIRNIQTAHSAVEIRHSLFEGDRMTFHQILSSRGDKLDRMRPIRFYTEESGVKLFDGVIIDADYAYIGGDYMALEVHAAGWWQELARMNLHLPIEYDGTWCINDIYLDLVRQANNMGVMKEAVYTYDTGKIPEYSTYDTYYEAATGTTFTFNNIYEGMKTLTQYLDAVTPCAYEFGLRIEALPRLDGITQSDTDDHIYILPFPINQDKAADATFRRFQLATGYNVERDYRQLANHCYAIGDGVDTQQIRTTKILERIEILDSDEWWARNAQVLASHYLRVTIENPTASNLAGYIQVKRVSGVTNPVETFPISIPAGGVQTHYTSELTEDGLPVGNCFRAVDLTGGKITVEEVSNDVPPYNTTIAGRSINTYGYAPKTIEALWLNTQEQVDHIAGKHCRLYHAPTHQLYAPITPSYVTDDNLIGNTAEFYSPYEAGMVEFLITDTVYGFRGKLRTQHLMGMRYEYEWDYDDS